MRPAPPLPSSSSSFLFLLVLLLFLLFLLKFLSAPSLTSSLCNSYYFSLEFLLGRAYDNALLNLDVKQSYNDSLKQLGFSLEDILDVERDMGLGNGGLGRLAACYLDSTSTVGIPAWGYTLRYQVRPPRSAECLLVAS